MGQSSSLLVLGVFKTEVLLDCDDPAYQNVLLEQFWERIEKLSQQDKLSKFCMDAGFLSVVENVQYFMSKDTGHLTQFHSAACREYILSREDEASHLKGWIQGNTKIGPVLEVATRYLHGKYAVDIRIWSLKRDNTHSGVRISHGSYKFVMNLNNNDTEIPEDQLEEFAVKQNAKKYCMPIEGKRNHKEEIFLILHQESFPWKERIGSILNKGNTLSSNMRYRRKQRFFFVIHNMCIEKKTERFISVVKENLQSQFTQSTHWSDARWRACLEARGGEKRIFQYCIDASRTIVYFRALDGHLGHIVIDLSLQDNVVIPSNFFQDIYVQSAFYHQLWINTWRSKIEHETDSILPACWFYGQKSQGS